MGVAAWAVRAAAAAVRKPAIAGELYRVGEKGVTLVVLEGVGVSFGGFTP